MAALLRERPRPISMALFSPAPRGRMSCRGHLQAAAREAYVAQSKVWFQPCFPRQSMGLFLPSPRRACNSSPGTRSVDPAKPSVAMHPRGAYASMPRVARHACCNVASCGKARAKRSSSNIVPNKIVCMSDCATIAAHACVLIDFQIFFQPTFALKVTVLRIYVGKMLNALIQVLDGSSSTRDRQSRVTSYAIMSAASQSLAECNERS